MMKTGQQEGRVSKKDEWGKKMEEEGGIRRIEIRFPTPRAGKVTLFSGSTSSEYFVYGTRPEEGRSGFECSDAAVVAMDL